MTGISEVDTLVATLDLVPHPEGGHYREIYRHAGEAGARGAVTAIYYLLKAGERSAWHRIDAVEIWHHYAGAPLALHICEDGKPVQSYRLGPNILAGEHPQVVVPVRAWQSAEPLGAYALVGCTVAPAFSFDGFEMAPAGWQPGSD